MCWERLAVMGETQSSFWLQCTPRTYPPETGSLTGYTPCWGRLQELLYSFMSSQPCRGSPEDLHSPNLTEVSLCYHLLSLFLASFALGPAQDSERTAVLMSESGINVGHRVKVDH